MEAPPRSVVLPQIEHRLKEHVIDLDHRRSFAPSGDCEDLVGRVDIDSLGVGSPAENCHQADSHDQIGEQGPALAKERQNPGGGHGEPHVHPLSDLRIAHGELLHHRVLKDGCEREGTQEVEKSNVDRQEGKEERCSDTAPGSEGIPQTETEKAGQQSDVLEVGEELKEGGVHTNQCQFGEYPRSSRQGDPPPQIIDGQCIEMGGVTLEDRFDPGPPTPSKHQRRPARQDRSQAEGAQDQRLHASIGEPGPGHQTEGKQIQANEWNRQHEGPRFE